MSLGYERAADSRRVARPVPRAQPPTMTISFDRRQTGLPVRDLLTWHEEMDLRLDFLWRKWAPWHTNEHRATHR